MVGSLYQPPPPSLPVAATAATLLLAVAAALAAVATLLLAVVVALAVATAAATEKSIDALRQSDRAVLRGLPIRLEEAHSHSDGAVHGAPSAGHSGSRHSDPSSQEQPSGKSFDGRGGKFIPTPTTLSRRGRTVRPPHLSGGGAQRGVAELLHHVAGREALVTPDFQSVEVEKLDSEGGDCGAEGRHFAPGGGEALCRNGARKKETKKTLAKVAAKRKQSRTGARRLWPARLLWPSWLLWPSTVRRAWEDRQGCCWREDHTECPLVLGLQWCGRLWRSPMGRKRGCHAMWHP